MGGFLDGLLGDHSEIISLISTSVFGMQKDTPIYKDPEKYDVIEIVEEKRTVLEPKLTYSVKKGLTREGIFKLKKKNMNRILRINKFPKNMNYFREQMLCLVSDKNKLQVPDWSMYKSPSEVIQTPLIQIEHSSPSYISGSGKMFSFLSLILKYLNL